MTNSCSSTRSMATFYNLKIYHVLIIFYPNRIYMPASWIVAFIGPICICHYVWGEDFMSAYYINMLRYILGLHVNWSINSFAHIVGNRPYDK